MRNPFAGLIIGLMAAGILTPMLMGQTGAGESNGSYDRLAGGINSLYDRLKDAGTGGPAPKHDVTGVWTGLLEAQAGSVPPMTPLGEKRFSMNKTERKAGWADSNDPWKTCDPFGFPRSAVNEITGMAFAEMPDKIIVLHQYNKIWREVWMDGRELPKNVDMKGGPDSTWYGYSVGHWEGDYTLVIDTTGSDDSSWLDPRGYPHSVDGHYQERYTRVDHNHLEMTVTVDDPKIYTKPFVLGMSKFVWVPDQKSQEQICVPSEAINYVNVISKPATGKNTEGK
ncbi:MAG: hypothetical protein DMG30_18045 [Acidobacteria bacterium]|nr:MAG: hypothetical protein DMG30_18045 [Acidobacteriota bacterium]